MTVTKGGDKNAVLSGVVHLTLRDDNKTWHKPVPPIINDPSQESDKMGLLIGLKCMGEVHILTTSLALC